jgi:hypothetical protein
MRLDVDVLDVMEKSNWMLNPRDQPSHDDSYRSKCQLLLNQDIE